MGASSISGNQEAPGGPAVSTGPTVLDLDVKHSDVLLGDTVSTSEIEDLAVTAGKLAALAVETAKIDALAVTAAKIGALAVETAKIDALAVTAAKIGAGAVTSPKLENGLIQFQDTQLNAAALNGLLAANVEVVAEPAAGLAVDPIAVHMFLDHGGTDFVQAADTDQLALLYNGGSELFEIGLAATVEAFLEASADAVMFWEFIGNLTNTGGRTPVAATAIDLDNNGASEYATGNGTLSIRVYYRVLPMAAFS